MKKLFIIVILIWFPIISYAKLPASYEVLIDQSIAKYAPAHPIMNLKVLHLALESYLCATRVKGIKDQNEIFTIIDYSLTSNSKRMWVLDLKNKKVLYFTLVAHGKLSGTTKALHFLDQPHSLQSSIGLFRTGSTYYGHDGYSLKITGLEKGFNDKAEDRHIIIHGAWYVSRDMIKRYGTIGRSWGCPALDEKIIKPVIDTIKDGTLVFVYYPDPKWLKTSTYLQCTGLKSKVDKIVTQQ